MLSTRGFMLDTCTINRICDQKANADTWRLRGPIYITDIQMQEIAQTGDEARRESLFATLFALNPSVVRSGTPPTRTGDFWLGCDQGYDDHEYLGSSELSLERQVPIMAWGLGSSPRKLENRLRDALIAEAARTNDLTLITADMKLAEVAERFGIYVETIQ